MDDRPIGVFDSGFGGLTVVRALVDLVPNEHLVYLGDTGRYPYGPRALEEVCSFALQIAKYLVAEHGVKMLVVACNTAAAAGLEEISVSVDIPVIGVIDPGVRAMLRVTRSGRVGVIGTVGTIASGAYQRAVSSAIVPLLPTGEEMAIDLTCAACPGFVEFVEKGDFDSDQVHVLAERLLKPLGDAVVDTLLLGCTHYPFLARTIADVMGPDVVLVSSAEETAFEVRSALMSLDLLSAGSGSQTFLSSGDAGWFRALGARLLGMAIDEVGEVAWG